MVASSSPTCLSFKTMMYGSSIGTLKVLKLRESPAGDAVLFTKSGDQGNKWLDVEIDLPVGEKFQIEISGVRASGYRGDIAIDELRVHLRRCGQPAPVPTPGPPTVPSNKGCGVPRIQNTRVIAGKDAVRGSWPWQILMLFAGRPICGGTLINPTTVVTAAHCVAGKETPASRFKVRVGDHSMQTTETSQSDIQVSRIISHPSYKSLDYDIAVMKLSRPAIFGTYVSPACMPNSGIEPRVGSTCYITGWGKIKHPGSVHHTLQQASLKVVSQSECARKNTFGVISARMICAGNGAGTLQSGCHGDSGGPFVCQSNGKWYLQGAVSWGSSTCSAARSYTVFAKTSNPDINAWIKNLA